MCRYCHNLYDNLYDNDIKGYITDYYTYLRL